MAANEATQFTDLERVTAAFQSTAFLGPHAGDMMGRFQPKFLTDSDRVWAQDTCILSP